MTLQKIKDKAWAESKMPERDEYSGAWSWGADEMVAALQHQLERGRLLIKVLIDGEARCTIDTSKIDGFDSSWIEWVAESRRLVVPPSVRLEISLKEQEF